jgi:hypothetical protein
MNSYTRANKRYIEKAGKICDIKTKQRDFGTGTEQPATIVDKYLSVPCQIQFEDFKKESSAWQNLQNNQKYLQPYKTAICFIAYYSQVGEVITIFDITRDDIVIFEGKTYEILQVDKGPSYKGEYPYNQLYLITNR